MKSVKHWKTFDPTSM